MNIEIIIQLAVLASIAIAGPLVIALSAFKGGNL
uniref:Photosystem II reaction center protein Psb30 n=1 Tax=Actinostachys pennula TaxID=148577 RepID=A0A1U7AFM2_9MONI|nr:conserved hypothetical protein Ycf12 [Actinostachys pennula]